MLMKLGDWLPTRVVFGVSDDWRAWVAGATIMLAITFAAWKLIVVVGRAR